MADEVMTMIIWVLMVTYQGNDDDDDDDDEVEEEDGWSSDANDQTGVDGDLLMVMMMMMMMMIMMVLLVMMMMKQKMKTADAGLQWSNRCWQWPTTDEGHGAEGLLHRNLGDGWQVQMSVVRHHDSTEQDGHDSCHTSSATMFVFSSYITATVTNFC